MSSTKPNASSAASNGSAAAAAASSSSSSSSSSEKKRKRSHRRSRSRSRSRSSKRHRSSRRSSRRSRSRDRSRRRSRDRGRSSDRSRRRPRSPSPPPAKKQLSPEELQEKMKKSALVYEMHPRASERDLFDLFAEFGWIEDIEIIKDPRTGRSKGVAYIMFKNADDMLKSMAAEGRKLRGHPIRVKRSYESDDAQAAAMAGEADEGMRLQFDNVPADVDEEDIKTVFESFGNVVEFVLRMDSEGKSTGAGTLFYPKLREGRAALSALNGVDVGGQPMNVNPIGTVARAFRTRHDPNNPNAAPAAPATPGAAAAPGNDSATQSMHAATMQTQMASGNNGVLDGVSAPQGISMGANARYALMQKLQRGRGTQHGHQQQQQQQQQPQTQQQQQPPTTAATPAVAAPQRLMQPTTCVIVKNMFNPEEETDEDWHVDIKEDVEDECAKFGPLKHIFVDKDSPHGHVYLRFHDIEVAKRVQQSFHNRYFARRQLSADFVPEGTYSIKFPKSNK
eukprot:TRINITY_DN67209_c1_g1_i1.p2 TRINITY_DN67209_c1_g1~~TRINITY_DN67209_c1_g1_i1.p2  ORF type:complete len:507 (+),score=270.65 TRINITY_DN67209_c1_g1_i1:2-1522(+)